MTRKDCGMLFKSLCTEGILREEETSNFKLPSHPLWTYSTPSFAEKPHVLSCTVVEWEVITTCWHVISIKRAQWGPSVYCSLLTVLSTTCWRVMIPNHTVKCPIPGSDPWSYRAEGDGMISGLLFLLCPKSRSLLQGNLQGRWETSQLSFGVHF
jgi:hypothetical protein